MGYAGGYTSHFIGWFNLFCVELFTKTIKHIFKILFFGIFLRGYFCFCVRRSSIDPECIGLQPQDRLCRVFSIMLSHIENNDLSLSAARTLSRCTLARIDCGGVQLPHRLYTAASFHGCRLQRSRPVWIIVVPGRHLDKREKNLTKWGRVEQVTF